jgi:hypothetical protein
MIAENACELSEGLKTSNFKRPLLGDMYKLLIREKKEFTAQ